jgi:serine/tyrosine/threonine adenylyltransferase
MNRYLQRIQADEWDDSERQQVMNTANPKYVLRNWMSTMAYERSVND